jgi:hypothetical protein
MWEGDQREGGREKKNKREGERGGNPGSVETNI